ncbi:MAG: GNAT family N-acetyltransferase [Flavobacteriales bacterium]|nr:GNAT family N-acetyltransferase [Flavobacteriales bacterium]
MITITTLEEVSLGELVEVFNKSFEKYFVPVSLSLKQLEEKIKSENIDLAMSVGVFKSNKLVGFVLLGVRTFGTKKVFYNAATGVILEERGQGLTARMYQFILPILRQNNFTEGFLEVISQNTIAIKIYQKIGFTFSRELFCYKGIPKNISTETHNVLQSTHFDWKQFEAFWDFRPTWQNASESLEIQKEMLQLYVCKEKNLLIGYGITDPKGNRLKQLAVNKDYRNKGIGRAILNKMANNNPIVIINVDANDKNFNNYLDKIGLSCFVTQHEMLIRL